MQLQCDYYKRDHLDKVDQSDYRKITVHFETVVGESAVPTKNKNLLEAQLLNIDS